MTALALTTADHPITVDVMAAQTGDRDAFTRLVNRHANTVCAVILAIVSDVHASEEIAQDVFLHAWKGMGNLRNPDSFGAWIRQLARNKANDFLRGHVRRKRLFAHVDADRADPGGAADRMLLEAERARALSEALDELPADSREVIALYYREGRSVRQVAELLELQEATVRKRMSRARALLRDDVLRRLGEDLSASAPGAAFVAGVSAALAAASPSTAWAAGTAAATGAVKGAIGGAMVGTTFGLAGVYLGYRRVARGARTDAEREQLRRFGTVNAGATLFAGLCFLFLPAIPGTGLGMGVLIATLWFSHLVWLPAILAPRHAAELAEDPAAARRHARQRLGGLVGLALGTACGLGGAVAGLYLGGFLGG